VLAYTGAQPAFGSGFAVVPPTGALTYGPVAAVVVKNATVIPATGTFNYAGVSSQLNGMTNESPPSGSLTFAGYAPQLGFAVVPGTGALTYVGELRFRDMGIHPGTGALAFTGLAPQQFGGAPLIPDTGALSFDGSAPLVLAGIVPMAGALAFASDPPQVLQTFSVAPNCGALAFAGQVPGVVMAPAILYTQDLDFTVYLRERAFTVQLAKRLFTVYTSGASGMNGDPPSNYFDILDKEEARVLTFDFSADLLPGEVLTGTPEVVITTVMGVDPNALDRLLGGNAFDTTFMKYFVPVNGGLTNAPTDDIDYLIRVVSATSNPPKTLTCTGILPVRKL
jgi:hypothetical protein